MDDTPIQDYACSQMPTNGNPQSKPTTETMTGARIIVRALQDQGVDTIFGYPGGAVLPIYDVLYEQRDIKHILVRHEQGATHAAEGYARSSGKVGVVLVTSGPGATNTVTGITDALMDSIPLVVITGQVPTFAIGTDAFQEADTIGITRPCTKHSWLVQQTDDLANIIHQAFHIAASGRPGPVLIDIPKDVQFATGVYTPPKQAKIDFYQPRKSGDSEQVDRLVAALETAERPVFYTGGGVINSGTQACTLLTALVQETNFPITSTLMGLGGFAASKQQWLGMLGMHGLYEANMSMYECDLMINVGARFDDRITGRISDFAPHAQKAHIDIDPSSINKVIHTHIPIIGDVATVLEQVLNRWRARGSKTNGDRIEAWWQRIDAWKQKRCLAYAADNKVIKPQYALERLQALTQDHPNRFITTEVGQHQMWAAQFIRFDHPRQWLTSGGLGTMGYGLPASIGAQLAHPDGLVINVAGEASWLMNMQEMGTAIQYCLPVKQFILNNEHLGMVRQWQQLLHEERYSHSWSEALPDFVKLAEAFGCKGIRCSAPDDLDQAIQDMLDYDGAVIFDCRVTKDENCFPMIPSGEAHNNMLFGEKTESDISDDGAVLV